MNAVPAIGDSEAALRSHYAGVRSRLMPAPLSDGRKAVLKILAEREAARAAVERQAAERDARIEAWREARRLEDEAARSERAAARHRMQFEKSWRAGIKWLLRSRSKIDREQRRSALKTARITKRQAREQFCRSCLNQRIIEVRARTGASKAAIMGRRRWNDVVAARQLLAFMLVDHDDLSTLEVAKLMHLDHTTVLYAVKKVRAALAAPSNAKEPDHD